MQAAVFDLTGDHAPTYMRPMFRVGTRNLITDVDGIKVGNAQDTKSRTGTTVLAASNRLTAAVDVRGGGPGTRETDALDASCLVDALDAIVLSGGSSYGLAAASGVAAKLGASGQGYQIPGSPRVSPIVPAAILFDLTNGGDKEWGEHPPYDQLGRDALDDLGDSFDLGNSGAGLGAKAGSYKGGLGSASAVGADGVQVGALVAVNPFGSPVMPGSAAFWAWPFEQNGEFGGARPAADYVPADMGLPGDTKMGPGPTPGANTTIGIVATNVALAPAELKRVAMMAQDGYARAIRPIHTMGDGDVVFAVSTAARQASEPRAGAISTIGAVAADCMARAVARGVYAAETLGGIKSYRDGFSV